MIEKTQMHGVNGTVAYFDAKGIPTTKENAVRGEVHLENGEFYYVEFLSPQQPPSGARR